MLKFLYIPLWFGLLALPFMGWAGAGRLVFALGMGGLVGWAFLRLLSFIRLQQAKEPVEEKGRGIMIALKSLNQIRLFWGGLFLLFLLPVFLNNYYLDILSLAWLYGILAVGLNITVGYTGLLDLGYAAFYGVGAYVYGLLSTGVGLSFWLGLPVGGGIAALFGLGLGMITLRLRGDYLAIVTLGFVQIVYLIFNNWDSVTNGPNGILAIGRPQIGGFVFRAPIHFYYLSLVFLIITATAAQRLIHSQIGRAWMAIREDSLAAETIGINTTRMKIFAFVLGSGIAGVAGVFFAGKYTFISPESFTFLESVRILSMVVLGGMGSLPGAILGAFLLTLLPELLRGLANYRMLIFGAALVVMMLFRPQGLMGKKA
ncbi:MAG TPA: hypothetical protein VI382_01185 [Candidatus Manganitrophaceae bacterium]|nr:hypothetical protein [Candidatus Manganitrophaceae bacterium]